MPKKFFLPLFLVVISCDIKSEKIDPSSIRVEVLNATGERHLARIVSMELRRKGFDVIHFGNADDTLDYTIIFDRKSPEKKYAKILARSIGCKRIRFEPDPQKLCEVSIIIGKDYKKIFKDLMVLWK